MNLQMFSPVESLGFWDIPFLIYLILTDFWYLHLTGAPPLTPFPSQLPIILSQFHHFHFQQVYLDDNGSLDNLPMNTYFSGLLDLGDAGEAGIDSGNNLNNTKAVLNK